MKPPTPTRIEAKEKQQERRAALVPMIVALAAVLVLAGYIGWQRAHPPRVNSIGLDERSQMAADPNSLTDLGANDLADPLSDVMGKQGVSDLLLMSSTDQPLTGEPAGLNPFPGAKRTGGVRRMSGRVVEEFTFWEAAGASAEQMIAHYDAAAKSAGFTPLAVRTPTTAASNQAVTRLYRRVVDESNDSPNTRPGPQTLRIRVASPMTNGAATSPSSPMHVMVWMRYAIARSR